MLKFIIKLGISALLTYATWHVGSAYVGYYRLKDAAEQAALTPGLTDAQLRTRVMQMAEENGAQIEEERLDVRRDARHIFVDAAYVQPIEVLPGYRYPWHFEWSVDVLIIPPMGISPRNRPNQP
jgi:hypothetical protein